MTAVELNTKDRQEAFRLACDRFLADVVAGIAPPDSFLSVCQGPPACNGKPEMCAICDVFEVVDGKVVPVEVRAS